MTIVPDRHGEGTNALLLTLPPAIEPAFGPGSLERHTAAARASGAAHRVDEVGSLALDVDTPEDLAELRDTLVRTPRPGADDARRAAPDRPLPGGRHGGARRAGRGLTALGELTLRALAGRARGPCGRPRCTS